jgi:ubiquinone/menaquinone biosynthesis C-methylase UbiE
VLDVSTGTGEAALGAITVAGLSGRVIGVDISVAMLEGARARLETPLFLPVTADGQALPFADQSFDSIMCHLGLQFFPDPSLGLREFRRVLRRGQRLGLCVISTADHAPMWGVLADTVGRLRPELWKMLHLSFALDDPSRLAQLLKDAGFADVQVVLETREDAFANFDDYWAPIEAGPGSIPQGYLSLSVAERQKVREEVQARLARFLSASALRMSVEMLIAQGRA